ncbi:MAG: DNA-binding protein [Chthoniobacteraceae bacterium]
MPEFIDTIGELGLLAHSLTAFFCSAKCPGEVILRAYDAATRWRDERRVIVSGFHSPVERDCLRILLRGKQPIIICPARTLDGFRVPEEWQPAFDEGRLLLLSPFPNNTRRTSARLAAQRNEFVAALADEAVFAHTTPGGHTDRLRAVLIAAGKPVRALENGSGLPIQPANDGTP